MTSKESLHEFNRRLLTIHRVLLDRARRGLEAESGRSIAPLEFLNLLRSEASLRWLQPLTDFIVRADALTDKKYELQPHDVAKLKVDFAALFLAPEKEAPLAPYAAGIRNDPELRALHERILEAFERI